MGGSRCSYRTCTVKSDGKTHLFHYPVFDKVRCHQWITNAHKLNFMDLKLSQLKNRMVCEHHFTDNCFMNDMKARLKNSAIPTLDGPYCKPIELEFENEADEKEVIINLDDIENECITNLDKKAHFSVKYGDFLTNEVSEPITLTPNYHSTSIMVKDNGIVFNRDNDKIFSYLCNLQKNLNQNNMTPLIREVETNIFDVKGTDFLSDEKNKSLPATSKCQDNSLPNPKIMAIEFEEFKICPPNPDRKPDDNLRVTKTTVDVAHFTVMPSNKCNTVEQNPQRKKVQIISEKKIAEPVKVPKGKLHSVSPSIVLKVPDRRMKGNVELNGSKINTVYVDMLNSQQVDYGQDLNNSNVVTLQSDLINQMSGLTDYNEATFLTNTVENPNNIKIQSVDLVTENKETDYNMNSGGSNRSLIKQNELVSDVEPIQMIPNVEFVSQSSTGPSVFTLTDVPHVTTEPDSKDTILAPYAQESAPPTESLINYSGPANLETNVNTSNDAHWHSIEIESNNSTKIIKIPKDDDNLKKNSLLINKVDGSFLKSKLPPEKLAAIREKRQFNMRLRDIINSCLSKLDDENDVSKLTAAMRKELIDKKRGAQTNHPALPPTGQENVISYLETRLKRLENTLVNKIEQNSQRITDLKKIVVKSLPQKKSAFTQTYLSSETTKKNLYQEISQFLTPEANNLIYEELFINKCSIIQSEPSFKKRKRN